MQPLTNINIPGISLSSVGSGISGFVNVVNFGADPSGTRDSASSIQSAIDSLAPGGGIAFFPPGVFKISTTIVVGNGSSGGVSTNRPVNLIGAGGPFEASNNGMATGVTTIECSNTTATAFLINGPISGWGIQSMTIGSASGGSLQYGIDLISASYGFCRDICVNEAFGAGIRSRTHDPFSGVNNGDSLHNIYLGTFINMPAIDGSIGVLLDGGNVSSITSDTDYSNFIDLTIVPKSVSSGNTSAIYLKVMDNCNFFNVQILSGPTTTGSIGVFFDYGLNASFPGGAIFYTIDNNAATPYFISGSPSNAAPHQIYGIQRGNGGVPPNTGTSVISYYEASSYRNVPTSASSLAAIGGLPGAQAMTFDCSLALSSATIGTTNFTGGGNNYTPVYFDPNVSAWRIG